MSQRMIQIVDGRYRGNPVNGVFPLLRDFQEASGAEGTGMGTVKIYNANAQPGHTTDQRIKVRRENISVLGEGAALEAMTTAPSLPTQAGVVSRPLAEVNPELAFRANETEEEAMARIANTFQMFDRIVEATADGVIRGLIVSGPPGVGKSFGVEKILYKANMARQLAGRDPQFEVISGAVSPPMLYQKLYHNRAAEQVLVFDDCDGVLFEDDSLNLLKAALNSGHRRRISWNKLSRALAAEDIPQSFDYEGSVIFLSNINFERSIEKGSRISEHLKAIMSRCHYLDLEISSDRDKLLRIKQIVRGGMLKEYDFSPQEEEDIVSFVMDNSQWLREISLRIVKKIADFAKAMPGAWYEVAEATTLKREAKYQRLIRERAAQAESALAEVGVVLQEIAQAEESETPEAPTQAPVISVFDEFEEAPL